MNKKVIYCHCKGNIIDSQRIEAMDTYISGLGASSVKIADLCGICATRKDEVKNLFFAPDEILIIACYPRAVKLLLKSSGVEIDTKNISYLNFRETDNQAIFNQVQDFINGEIPSKSHAEIESESKWPSWFPVIDDARCSACGQCADFCLFGVYEKTATKIQVVNPKGCKNNCPACARICPHTAIVFPKYQQGGAIAGAETIDEIAEQQRQRQDMNDILGSDIYQALEQRKAKRRAIVRAEAMKKAMEERDKALNEGLSSPQRRESVQGSGSRLE